MSNSTSDTEAGLPGGNFRSKFSLYSTDTEEKVSTAMHHEMKSLLESSAGLAIYTIYTSGCYTHRGFTLFIHIIHMTDVIL